MAVAADGAVWLGTFAGGIGAFVGAFAGYRVRKGLVQSLRLRDSLIAVAEDLIAIGLGVWLVTRL